MQKRRRIPGILRFTGMPAGNFTFEYSPESFQGTEVDYALEVCNAVLDIWQPTPDNKAVINLPTTVENAMPHVFASQVEYFNKHLVHREYAFTVQNLSGFWYTPPWGAVSLHQESPAL